MNTGETGIIGRKLSGYSGKNDRYIKLIGKEKFTSPERVFSVFQKSLEPLSKQDIMILFPDISQRTVERALKELQDSGKTKQVWAGRSTKYISI